MNNFQKKIGDTPTDAFQLVNKKYVDGKMYIGYVQSTGVPITNFPSGWSVVHGSTGNYVITHNLNLIQNSYIVLAMGVNVAPLNDATWGVLGSPLAANSFTVQFMTYNSGTGLFAGVNTDFNFILAT